MYNAFFEFEENPFSSQPDSAFFYRSKQHDTAIRSLTFAVQARMGLSSLVGEEGTGKTLLLECLRDTLESTQIHCAFLRDSRLSTNRFFQAVAAELGLKSQGTSPYQVFSALHQFTLQQARKGRTVALIVDDAHNLPADVLNEILHLASLHDDKIKLLQTVLAGRPELHSTLDALNLERLKQHAILSCHLDPFTAAETERYIEFRLQKAGLPDQTIFPPDAISEIYVRSRGFAPAIHAICEGLLLAAFSAGSKVCTSEILDQVFRNPGAGLGVNTSDLPHLAALAEPEPVAALTAMLRLTFAATKILPPPLPVAMTGLLEPQRVALRLMFPGWKFILQVGEFVQGEKEPMRRSNAVVSAARTRPEIHAIPSAVTISTPVLSKPALQAEPRLENTLQRISANNPALTAPRSTALAMPIDFPGVALQPSNSAADSLKAATVLLTPKGVKKLARLSGEVKPNSGIFAHADVPASVLDVPASLPMHPAAILQPAGAGWRRTSMVQLPATYQPPASSTGSRNVDPTAAPFTQSLPGQPTISARDACKAVAPRTSNELFSLDCSMKPRPGVAAVRADAQSVSIAPVIDPGHPTANLQPVGNGQLPRVPVTPFGIAEFAPPAARTNGDFQKHLVSLPNPVGPRIGMNVASDELNAPEHDRFVSLSCNVAPSAPPAKPSIKPFLSLLQTLRPIGPESNIEAINPRNAWLLLPSWKPAAEKPVADSPAVERRVADSPPIAFDTVLAETKKSAPFDQKWLLTLAIPVLSIIALYGLMPRLQPTSALTQSWNRVHQAVVDRAAVAYREDFRTGWDDWMNRAGARPGWTSDAAGFAHPGSLALYRPSLGLSDYHLQFVGTIDKKALSWVVRAADFNNYYAIQLAVLKPGPIPTIGVTRYAVINGKTQNQVTTPLLMSARSDTVYRVSLDVTGDRYQLSVQDQLVESWSEPKLRHGGIGFFSEPDAASRIAGLQVKGQDDMLGKLCAFLVPSDAASYRASLSSRAVLSLIAAADARNADGFGRRLPHGPVHLDPAFWQQPEINLPNARRCAPPTSRLGVVRTRRSSPFNGPSSSTPCY